MKSQLLEAWVKRYGALVIALVFTLSGVNLLAQGAPEPRKGDTVGWHDVRAGETLSGITERYLGDALLWRENHRLNPGIQNPDVLTPGMRIRVILAREIAARRADVDQVSRRVEKKPRADEWTNARVGDQIVEREGLRTYPKSSAELGFDDGSNLILTENSIVFLREYRSSLRRVDRSLIEVVDGGIDVAVTPQAADSRRKEVEIVLGEVKAKPKASQRNSAKTRAVKDSVSNAALLMVYAGSSQVESAGVSVRVAEGMGTSVTQGQAPPPPERLLRAPKLSSPAAGESVNDSVEVAWAAVPRAESYTLEVCRDEACAQLVDRQVNLTATSAATATLPSGDLHWRVTAKSKSGLDGYPSATRRIVVARQIVGRVLIDRTGELDSSTWTGAFGASVEVFRDDGSGAPDAADSLVIEQQTAETGGFAFPNVANGVYWLVVDSKSVSPSGTWYEQVAGPGGSICADGSGGSSTIDVAGPCFGGRRGGASDDASSLATAEHVVRISVEDEIDLGSLDIVFSPSVVTTIADSDEMPQGSLRRFMANAAILSGDDAMRFVPMEPLEDGKSWWTITLVGALPPVDDTVTIDGRAWTGSGDARDTNEGQISEPRTVGVEQFSLEVADRPELEIEANGASRPLMARSGTLRLHGVAFRGATDAELTSVGTLEVENCLIATTADGSATETASIVGVEVAGAGTAELTRTFIRTGGSYGILVRSETAEARVIARDVDLVGCAAGAGIRIESNGSRLHRIRLAPCDEGVAGLGLELKGSKGASNQFCRDNRITESTILRHERGIKLRIGAMDNWVDGNLFETVADGVYLEIVMGFWVPKGNLIRRNVWKGPGETITLSGMPDVKGLRLFEEAVPCSRAGWSVDRGLDFPGIISVTRSGGELVLDATICPCATIEVYGVSDASVSYLGSYHSDDSGRVEERFEAPSGVEEVGVIAVDHGNTTSRMNFIEID